MKPPRLLLLTQFFTPETAARAGRLAAGMRARGHDVTVLTGFPNYPGGKVYPGYRVRWRQREELHGVPVERVPLYPSHDRSGLRRALNYLSFAASAALLGPGRVPRPDVLWTYHPPLTTALPAHWFKRRTGCAWVHEVQDLWPETLAATGMVRPGPVTAALGLYAKQAYAAADALTVISPGFARNLAAKGVPPAKVHVLPNWADEATYRPVPPDPALAARHGFEPGCFHVLFAGNMGRAQGLENLVEAAALLRDRLPRARFVMVGDGLETEKLRQTAAARGLAAFRFLGRHPAEAMPHLFALADVLLVHLRPDPLFEITIPSKTISYLACGRPILTVTRGDPAAVVESAGAGRACPPGDPAALAEAVAALAARPPGELAAMGANGRAAFLRLYSAEQLLDRYDALFRALAAGNGAGGLE